LAERIPPAAGGTAHVQPGDLHCGRRRWRRSPPPFKETLGGSPRHILVNNAGLKHSRAGLEAAEAGGDRTRSSAVILTSAFYCVAAALADDAGRSRTASSSTPRPGGRAAGISPMKRPGPTPPPSTAFVAMSHTHQRGGMRQRHPPPASSAPAEGGRRPILDKRPGAGQAPRSAAKMVQARGLRRSSSATVACLPKQRPASNEVVISPAWNRGYVAIAGERCRRPAKR